MIVVDKRTAEVIAHGEIVHIGNYGNEVELFLETGYTITLSENELEELRREIK